MNRKDAYLWLKSIPSITNLVIEKIENNNIKIEEIIDMSENEIYNIENVNINIKKNIIKHKSYTYLDTIKEKLYKKSVEYICIDDDEYPTNLKNIYNSPKVLFYKGNINILKKDICLAMIGSRKCTAYGINCAKSFSKQLAGLGINIVSGLAIGIDSYAHIGCLEGNGKTIGVLGSPIDNILPKKNTYLAQKILDSDGLIISEYNVGDNVFPSNYVHRNRIISGISDGVIVVEAAKKSGSLITADYALEQGKNVFAIPGNINSCMSEGCHNIIKQGAKLIQNIEDILEEYEIINTKASESNQNYANIELNDNSIKIIEVIKNKGISNIDDICNNTEIEVNNVNSILNELVLKDILLEMENNTYSLNV